MKKWAFLLVLAAAACTSNPPKDIPDRAEMFPVETAPYVKKWEDRNIAAEELPEYQITGTCAGFPRIKVKTAPGFCVGLVDNGEGMVFPRTALELNNKDVLVVDMGGWKHFNGRLYMLKLVKGKYQRSTIFAASTIKDPTKKGIMDYPHLVLRGPDGLIYLGSAGMISRFNPYASDIEKSFEIVVDNIPKEGLHPLKAFAFDDDGNLFVNVGSATNVCEKQGVYFKKRDRCSEAEETEIGQALVRKYFRNRDGSYASNYTIYSRGLRNSMGLYWDSKNQLLIQAENGRDEISKFSLELSNVNLPHEELNYLYENKHYGWPYCYDDNKTNMEWTNVDCRKYEPAALLLPAHSSPLSIMRYQGDMFPAWYKNRLLVSLHGFEPRGHRLITYKRDDRALPVGKPLSIIYGWDKNGKQDKGSPVGISEMKDGSLLIVEDNSRKVLRLAYNASEGNGTPVDEIPDVIKQTEEEKNRIVNLKRNLEKTLQSRNAPTFAYIQKKIIDVHCSSCHSGADARGMQLDLHDFEANERRIIRKEKAKDIFDRMDGTKGLSAMPPDGFTNERERQEVLALFKKWMDEKGL